MKFLFASDSFKGTLSSRQIIDLLTVSAKKVFPECQTEGVLVADGGEGTVEAVIEALKGTWKQVLVHGPLMEPQMASYGICRENLAVIEMACASGLPLVPETMRNPFLTTTYGTGELIKDALEHGCQKIVIAIGGSATNDGGMGAMRALGIRFLDSDNQELSGMGSDLSKVADIDTGGLHPLVSQAEFTVMCDVTNPLTGPCGATYTFGAQKGGTKEMLDELEAGMLHYASILNEKTKIDVNQIPGSGAAGGLGAALCVFLQATLKPGIETVLDIIGFDRMLDGVDFVVTGEGHMDWQSAYGKVPQGVGKRCKARNIPAIAIVGGMGDGAEKLYDFGIESILTTVPGVMGLTEAMERAEELYAGAADRMFRLLKAGMGYHRT